MTEGPTFEQLLREAHECQKTGDFAEALDLYEEIDRRGLAGPAELHAMAVCYLQVRQRQTARQTWLRALELQPDFQPAIEQLDRHFKGWERPQPRRTPDNAVPPPSPPPLPASDSTGGLTVQTVQRRRPEPKVTLPQVTPEITHEVVPPVAARSEAVDFDEEPSAHTLRPTAHPAAASAAPSGAGARPADSINKVFISPVNWEYVMNDAMVESARR